jgi:hypothetical protein
LIHVRGLHWHLVRYKAQTSITPSVGSLGRILRDVEGLDDS